MGLQGLLRFEGLVFYTVPFLNFWCPVYMFLVFLFDFGFLDGFWNGPGFEILQDRASGIWSLWVGGSGWSICWALCLRVAMNRCSL